MVVRARIKFGGSEIIQYLINLGNEIGQCNMSTFISDRETRKTDHVSEQAITVNTPTDQVKSARSLKDIVTDKALTLTHKELCLTNKIFVQKVEVQSIVFGRSKNILKSQKCFCRPNCILIVMFFFIIKKD